MDIVSHYNLLSLIGYLTFFNECLKTEIHTLFPFKTRVLSNEEKAEVIISNVVKAFNAERDKVLSKSRKMENTMPRHVISYLLRKHLNVSVQKIGMIVKKDHSTVLNSCKVVEDMIFTNTYFRTLVQKLEYELNDQMGLTVPQEIAEKYLQ